MKKLAILFLILVIALFAVPGVVGFKLQSQYQELIVRLQQSGLEVVSDDYQRGWFGSRSETTFKLTPPSGVKGEPITFTMLQDIVHGPLSPQGGVALASVDTSFQVDGKALFPEEDNTIAHTLVGFNGDGTTIITIPALKLAGKPGRPEIQFSGADGKMTFDAGLSRFSMDIKLPEFWIGGENGEGLKFTGIALTSDSKSGLSGLLLGNGKLTIGQIDFNNPNKDVAVKIAAISVSGDTSEDDGKLTFNASYAVDLVKVNGVDYGPAQFELDLANIPAAVAAKLQQGIQEVRSQGLTKEQESMAIVSLMVGAGPELLQANPKLTIKRLYVKTPDGDIDGNLSVAVNGLQWAEISNFGTVLQKLDADAALSLPEKYFREILQMQAKAALVQQINARKKMGHEITMPDEEELANLSKKMAEQQLQLLLQQGLVKRDDSNLFSKAKLSGGLLSVNGKTVPLH